MTNMSELFEIENVETLVTEDEVEKLLEDVKKSKALDKHVKEAKAALKKSRGKTIDTDRAAEIAQEKGLDSEGKAVASNKKNVKSLVKAEKPVVVKPAPEKKVKVCANGVELHWFTTSDILTKEQQARALYERDVFVLLLHEKAWCPAEYIGANSWRLIYKSVEIESQSPIEKVKIVADSQAEIDAWQKKLGNSR